MASSKASPLKLLLGVIFILSASLVANAAVLGVDLGTEYFKAVLVKPRVPLEIVLTKDSRRKEISAVAFKPRNGGPKEGAYPERSYGADAIAVAARFPGEVFPNLKTLLGLPVGEAAVQEYAARHPALQLSPHPTRGTVRFNTKTLTPEQDAWMVEELLAMEIQNIRSNAETAAGDGLPIRSMVLTVPPFYTIEEKRAVRTAAELAGSKVLSLISDGLAVGLNYATGRQFPNVTDGSKPEYHVVFDMGAGSTKATVMRFQSRSARDGGRNNKAFQEVQVLGSGWDRSLGGDALNYLIIDDMVSQFVESKGAQKVAATVENVRAHGRAMAKLAKEAERIRHVLSANQNTQASFEGLFEGVDFKYKISRTEFEAMAATHAEGVGATVLDALKMAGLDAGDLTSVILHGGASRTPFVQKALEKAVGSPDKIRTNVNSDESAAFGAGFRAAQLSASFLVKDIRITDGSTHAAGLKWTTKSGKSQRQRLWTPVSALGGVPKEVTFSDPSQEQAVTVYQQIGSDDKDVMRIATQNLTRTVDAMKQKHPSCADEDLYFKLSLRLSSETGEVEVSKAAIECQAEVPDKEGFVDGVKNLFGFGKKEQQPLKEGETAEDSEEKATVEALREDGEASTSSSATPASSATASSDTIAETARNPEESKEVTSRKKKELVSMAVEVTTEPLGIPPLTQDEKSKSKDRLKEFLQSDKARVQREEALNRLEGYTYRVRDKLEDEEFTARSTEAELAKIAEASAFASEWLYGDGAEATKDELKAKLKELEQLVSPVQQRVDESRNSPALLAKLKESLNATNTLLQSVKKQIDEYEGWQASVSDNAPEDSGGAFDGLEDDATVNGGQESMENESKERGPMKPMYKREDLVELEELYQSVQAWIAEMEPLQQALSATDDPVLLSKDIQANSVKLQDAASDLVHRGMRNLNRDQKRPKKDGDTASEKPKKNSSDKKKRKSSSSSSKSENTERKISSDTSEQPPRERETVRASGGQGEPEQHKGKAEKQDAAGEEGHQHDEL